MQYGTSVENQRPKSRTPTRKWKTELDEQEIIHQRNLQKLKRDIGRQLREKGEIDYSVLNRPTMNTAQMKFNNARMNRQILTYVAPIGKKQNPEEVTAVDRKHNDLFMMATQKRLAHQQETQQHVQKVLDEAQTIRELKQMQSAFEADYNNYMRTIKESKRWK